MFWIFKKPVKNELEKNYGARTVTQYYNTKLIFELSFGQNEHYDVKLEKAQNWCLGNCTGLYDWQWQRGWWNYDGEFEINGCFGGDHVFFAFEKPQDAIMFKLRWG